MQIVQKLEKVIGTHLMFVQLASFLEIIYEMKGDSVLAGLLHRMLEDFHRSYKAQHNFDLKVEHIDFPQSLLKQIALCESNTAAQNQQIINIITEKKYFQKYELAHMKIAFNYGSYCKIFLENSVEKNSIVDIVSKSSIEEIIVMHNLFAIDAKPRLFDIDNLEEHALLNQIGEFQNNLILAFGRLEQESGICYHDCNKAVEKNCIDEAFADIKSIKKNGLDIQIALEVELVFEKSNPNKAQLLQYILSDINHRRFMQEKYQIPQTLPFLHNFTPLLNLLDDNIQSNYDEIISDAMTYMDANHFKDDDIEDIIGNIKKFPPECAIFYDILILQNGKHGISMNGISERADVLEYIRLGRFYEAILDMIHVSEISIGPYNAEEYHIQFERDIEIFNTTVAKYGRNVLVAGVQVNFSFWKNSINVTMPQVTGEDSNIEVYMSQYGVDILKLVQNGVIYSAKKPRIIRAQKVIDVCLDRKKGLNLAKSQYISIDENQTAFSIHKSAAAKNATIRVSVIPQTNISVAEIRLVGPNPHYPAFHEKPCLDAVSYISKTLIHDILRSISKAISIIEISDSLVKIPYNGMISSLPVCNIYASQNS